MNLCGASMLGLVAIHLLVGALLGFCVTVFIVIPIAAIALIEAFLVIDPDPVRLEVGAHRPIEICLPVYDVARVEQGQAHDAMRHHEWPRRPLLVCESQELDSKLTHHVAVKRHKIRDPKAVKNRE
jgi:hypothetical protein